MAVATTDKVQALIKAGVLSHGSIAWGNGTRQGFTINGKKYQYKMGGVVSKILKNIFNPLYITMTKSSEDKATKTIQKWIKKKNKHQIYNRQTKQLI